MWHTLVAEVLKNLKKSLNSIYIVYYYILYYYIYYIIYYYYIYILYIKQKK